MTRLTYCITLQHTVTHCNTQHHTAPHCNTLQHTATHCSTWHTYTSDCSDCGSITRDGRHDSTFQIFMLASLCEGHDSIVSHMNPLHVTWLNCVTHTSSIWHMTPVSLWDMAQHPRSLCLRPCVRDMTHFVLETWIFYIRHDSSLSVRRDSKFQIFMRASLCKRHHTGILILRYITQYRGLSVRGTTQEACLSHRDYLYISNI